MTAARSTAIRLGMITPSSNTTLEPVTYRLLDGADVTAHFARVPVTRIALDEGADAQFEPAPMVAAAGQLAEARVDAIAWNGTSGSWLGVERDQALAAAITQDTGIPATTSTLALMAACSAFGVRRLGLALPYTQDVADRMVATYARSGITAALDAEPFGVSDNEAFGRIPPADVAQQIRRAATGGIQAVAVVCTNVHGAEVVDDLERALGIPVFDSVTATLWHAMEVAGTPSCLAGQGTLLHTGSLRADFRRVLADVLAATGADRATVRVDLPEYGLHVDRAAGVALREGVRPARCDDSPGRRRSAAVQWLERNRAPLVQRHVGEAPCLQGEGGGSHGGVRARMMGPVERDGALAGWVCVHSTEERSWSDADVAALTTATTRINTAVDVHGGQGVRRAPRR